MKLGKHFWFCQNNFFRIAGTTTEQSFVRIHLGMKHIGYTIQQSFLSPNMLCIYASVPLWPYRSFALHLRMNKHDNVVLAGNLTYLNPTSLSVWELCNSPHIHFAVPPRIGSLSKKNTEVDQVTAMEIQVGSTASVLPSPASPLDSTSWCAHRTTHYLPGFGSQHLSCRVEFIPPDMARCVAARHPWKNTHE